MLKNAIIFTLFVLTNSIVFGQQNAAENYKIYSTLIKTEITDKPKYVAIVDRFKNDTTSIPWITEAINSKSQQQLEQLRFLTRDDGGRNSFSAFGFLSTAVLARLSLFGICSLTSTLYF